ncbi:MULTISPECIES: GNAT family N-acetyltransferase [unclassified Rhizobium]|uniref:GNAT family N-acetyltransferase n=1 Tax=Rhizobium TaxID=379 RepID=UPI00084C23C4|nr:MULTISPECIES: GNAT family N-acetyltransferase [unclassified Rhizobium]OED01638.1 GNAT family acetyltransferase [Rhizobium sp. YK2]QYA15849.1 GNAT family N-acetyltransferase [Rhizobium sp. AB2/73]UEQ84216.1 GNAT family N-acetyltransferase [Rhizobium sp. AB2/73]
MSHILDRPIWSALETAHASLSEGNALARRYPPSIVPFAASADNSPESLEALARLPLGEEVMAIVEAEPIIAPEGLVTLSSARLVQMMAERPSERVSDSRVMPLTEADAADMLALATLTKPGPFTLRAQSLGSFWGVKIDGRLVAMAGQRMRQTGFAELSGLCTHPDFQGRGLGTLLFRFVAGEIAARGETAYLHAYVTNAPAIALYEAMGFRIRSEMNFSVVKRQQL